MFDESLPDLGMFLHLAQRSEPLQIEIAFLFLSRVAAETIFLEQGPDGFVERGGMLLASAGCSSAEWDRSFRREMATIFPDHKLTAIGLDHAVFHTVYDIAELKAKHGKPKPVEGVSIDGRLGVIYSQDGLNDTEHSQGCCCCGGNEITNCLDVNVNILAYALTY